MLSGIGKMSRDGIAWRWYKSNPSSHHQRQESPERPYQLATNIEIIGVIPGMLPDHQGTGTPKRHGRVKPVPVVPARCNDLKGRFHSKISAYQLTPNPIVQRLIRP